MPLCPKCGDYYLQRCNCGFSAADKFSSQVGKAPSEGGDEGDKTVSAARRRIYDALSSVPESFSIKEIATSADSAESTVRKSMIELDNQGYVSTQESVIGTTYRLTEAGHTRFRYGSQTLGRWSEPRDAERLYMVLKNASKPGASEMTVHELQVESGVSEYLVRKTIKRLEEHVEAFCEDRDARPRKYSFEIGSHAIEILKPREFFKEEKSTDEILSNPNT